MFALSPRENADIPLATGIGPCNLQGGADLELIGWNLLTRFGN